jgi:hypothetical protein
LLAAAQSSSSSRNRGLCIKPLMSETTMRSTTSLVRSLEVFF